MKRLPVLLFVSGLIGILLLGVSWTPVAHADSKRKLTLEVAMGDSPSGINFADMNSPRGTVVLASGNIFPEETLPEGVSDFDPTDPSGAIGIWRCHFAALGVDSPLIGAVTYFFLLEDDEHDTGESMIIVQGFNSHTRDFMDSVPRVLAVVGGTGKYAGASGEVLETVIGTNSESRNLRFEFRISGVDDDDDD